MLWYQYIFTWYGVYKALTGVIISSFVQLCKSSRQLHTTLSLVGSDTDDIPIRWKSKSKCNGKSTIMFVSEEYLKLIDELYRLKRVEAISLVSVSIKDTSKTIYLLKT